MTTTLTNVETFTPNKLNSKFRRGPSKTRLEDLKIGKREYQARTVEEMKAVMENRIEETIHAIDTFDAWDVTIAKRPLDAPMAKRTLNGLKVKIGYGAKNEKFPDFMRPAEVPHLMGNPTKAKEKLKWEHETSFEELIKMMMSADLHRYGM